MKRRTFLQLSSLATAGILTGCATALTPAKPRFGLQLYSLRDVIFADPKSILKQVADFGYTQIESYEGDLGIYWGMKNTEFKSYLDDLGMELVASHFNMNQDLERKVDEAAEVGVKHLICPWIGPHETLDAYKSFADSFNKAGEICAKSGIRFAYHNHDYSFKPIDGVMGQTVLLDNTDPKLVDFEMDIYWVAVADEDPTAWFQRYPGRFTHAHVKDRGIGETVTLGTGTIDFASILTVGKTHGLSTLIVEQEQYTGTTPMDSARDNAKYMKRVLIG